MSLSFNAWQLRARSQTIDGDKATPQDHAVLRFETEQKLCALEFFLSFWSLHPFYMQNLFNGCYTRVHPRASSRHVILSSDGIAIIGMFSHESDAVAK